MTNARLVGSVTTLPMAWALSTELLNSDLLIAAATIASLICESE